MAFQEHFFVHVVACVSSLAPELTWSQLHPLVMAAPKISLPNTPYRMNGPFLLNGLSRRLPPPTPLKGLSSWYHPFLYILFIPLQSSSFQFYSSRKRLLAREGWLRYGIRPVKPFSGKPGLWSWILQADILGGNVCMREAGGLTTANLAWLDVCPGRSPLSNVPFRDFFCSVRLFISSIHPSLLLLLLNLSTIFLVPCSGADAGDRTFIWHLCMVP